jgi:hypothetical protein
MSLSKSQNQSIVKLQKEAGSLTDEFLDENGQALLIQLETDEEYAGIAEHLKSVKTYQKRLKEMRKALVEPFKKALEEVDGKFKSALKVTEIVEASIKEGMGNYISEVAAEAQEMLVKAAKNNDAEALLEATNYKEPSVSGISSRTSYDVIVIDAEAIPRQYLKIDEAAIKRVAKTGIEIPGVQIVLRPSIAVTVK